MLNTCTGGTLPAGTPSTGLAADDVGREEASRAREEEKAEAAERELATLSAHLDAAVHRQLELIRFIDESGRWYAQGAASCVHWLGWRIGLDAGAARERLRVAHALASLPAIDDALKRGALSYSKVRAMTRVATPMNEARLLELAQASTAAQLEKICRGLRLVQSEEPPLDVAPERWVRLRHRGDGTVRVEASLAPDEAERVMEAIRTVRAAMSREASMDRERGDGATGPHAERRGPCVEAGPANVESRSHGAEAGPTNADALVRMADVALANDAAGESAESGTRTGGADRAQVVVHLGPDALDEGYRAVLDDGTRVPAETFRRVACDCALVGVSKDARGDVLDIGRKSRSVSPALRRAVMLRDESCRFPGCAHDRFIDVHHVEHWIDGGETKLSNVVALCTHHHRLLHEGGFSMTLDASRSAQFFTPHGERLPEVHVPAETPDEPGAALESRHGSRGIVIDEMTGLTRWDGRRPDYGACVASVACVGPVASVGV